MCTSDSNVHLHTKSAIQRKNYDTKSSSRKLSLNGKKFQQKLRTDDPKVGINRQDLWCDSNEYGKSSNEKVGQHV